MDITCDGSNACILLEKDSSATLYNEEAAKTIYAALSPWKAGLTCLTIRGDAVDAEAYDLLLFDLLANLPCVDTQMIHDHKARMDRMAATLRQLTDVYPDRMIKLRMVRSRV